MVQAVSRPEVMRSGGTPEDTGIVSQHGGHSDCSVLPCDWQICLCALCFIAVPVHEGRNELQEGGSITVIPIPGYSTLTLITNRRASQLWAIGALRPILAKDS